MAKRPTTGRASLFRGKDDGVRVQGLITKAGGKCFEGRRKELIALYADARGHKPTFVSDADVIEFMARGPEMTRAYLEKETAAGR